MCGVGVSEVVEGLRRGVMGRVYVRGAGEGVVGEGEVGVGMWGVWMVCVWVLCVCVAGVCV